MESSSDQESENKNITGIFINPIIQISSWIIDFVIVNARSVSVLF